MVGFGSGGLSDVDRICGVESERIWSQSQVEVSLYLSLSDCHAKVNLEADGCLLEEMLFWDQGSL